MVIAISPHEPTEFVSKQDSDLPEEQRTTWLLRNYTVVQHSLLTNEIQKHANKAAAEWGDVALLILRTGLVGVRGFRDGNGAEVPFVTAKKTLLGTRDMQVPSDDFLDRIDAGTRLELTAAILKQVQGQKLTEEEAKN